MHATHPHPHPRRAVVAAVAALALALLALMPAAVADLSFGDRSTPTDVPSFAPTTTRAEPKWQDNPFAWPLLQVPGERARWPMQEAITR